MGTGDIKYLDRTTGEIVTETVMGDGALRFAYNTLLGRTLWPVLFGGRFVSALMGKYYDSPASRKDIARLTAIPGCDPSEAEYPVEHYNSFNDFFARRLKAGARVVDHNENVLVSPADGRISVHENLLPSTPIPVKGAKRSINELCGTVLPEKPFTVAVVRLAPVDYHRYHYPCDCKNCGEAKKISGKYHSVNPIAFAKAPDLFVENTRVVTCLESKLFGKFYFIDVGAFGVGSIVNTSDSHEHQKFDEKGFFKFGGSTVILIMDAEKVRFDADLVKNSANNLETLIKAGEQIGKAIK